MFYNVYIKEAHPVDGWRMSGNDAAGISFRQPKSFDERFGVAEQCSARLDMKTPTLIDDMDNTTCDKYAAFPDRLYIIDMEGKVAYKGGRGPFGYKPKELEQSLLMVMMDAQIEARKAAAEAEAKKKQAEKMAREKEEKRKMEQARKKAEAANKSAMKKKDEDKSSKPKTRPEPPGPDPAPKKKPRKIRGPIRVG